MNSRMLSKNRFLLLSFLIGTAMIAVPAFGQVINEDLKFIASDGAESDGFGYSIAFDNDIVAVGVWGNDDNSGSAYLFNASTGAQLFKLLPTDGPSRLSPAPASPLIPALLRTMGDVKKSNTIRHTFRVQQQTLERPALAPAGREGRRARLELGCGVALCGASGRS